MAGQEGRRLEVPRNSPAADWWARSAIRTRCAASTDASVDKGGTSSELVADAGITMSEITAASAEQFDGIGQVNAAIIQLDQMTQQNASLAEVFRLQPEAA
ncbi:hypothetical protein [Rivibacter subsaxonicus]|uniref:hypothetical protein n=1 Tax=Rivibacter subsaxonicus TaxID=457575 RepID=UPI001A9213E9